MNSKIIRNIQLNEIDYNDKRRTTALVLDVETTLAEGNETAIFDLGYTISSVSNQEMVIHRNYLVEEIFMDMKLMSKAYYFNKYPQYIQALASGNVEIKPFNEIISIMNADIKKYNVKTLYAYNSKFDSSAITKTHKIINGGHSALEYDIKCLWNLSTQTFMATQKFVLTALEQEWLSPVGNIKTSAEVAHRYLTKQFDFIESHTGLEDSVIETEILWAINRYGKKKDPLKGGAPWIRIRKIKQEMGL